MKTSRHCPPIYKKIKKFNEKIMKKYLNSEWKFTAN